MPDKPTKTALITGITGQDGSYLSELLIAKGYRVHGLQRRSSLPNTSRIHHLIPDDVQLHYGDMTDSSNLIRLVNDIQPDEIYNLAAQSHVQISFETPEYTGNADGLGATRLLEAIRILGLEKKTKYFQASTSELFGNAKQTPQNELTPFSPRSPYAAAKLYAYWMTVNYREAYAIYAVNGILFNHESPRRGEEFVSRKITLAVANIINGQQDCLFLGNLNARRDWGHARDYMQGVWTMMQQNSPDDYVLATGVTHSVREFAEAAFREAGIELQWSGVGQDEIGRDSKSGRILVRIDPQYYRPTDVDVLIGDATKAKSMLQWSPQTDFDALVREMVAADIKADIKRVQSTS